jgi:hypothetical protein
LLFFGIFVPLAVLPFSFLTYSNYIPSRNMYLPSIGIAALIGILFATLYSRSVLMRRACVFLFAGSILFNLSNIWFKHAPEYANRAAPTTRLLEVLGTLEAEAAAQSNGSPSLRICEFPLHPSIGVEVVRYFTNLTVENVVFSDECAATEGIVLRWDKYSRRYTQSLPFNQPQTDITAGPR